MRASNQHKRPVRRESGSFWLSFSDMMSVLVLVFIFVIFSMMLSLTREQERLEKTEEQYAEAMQRMQLSEQALSEKELLLASSQAQVLALTTELEGKALILAQKETELTEAQNALSVLQGNYDAEKNKVIVLGQENAVLLANAQTAQAQLTAEQAEKAKLAQRVSMLESNAAALQSEIDAKLALIAAREAELKKLNVDYQALMSANQSTQAELAQAQTQIQNKDAQLSAQSGKISEYETTLSNYRAELARTQGQLEQMVGVKAQIVQRLSSALKQSNIDVTVDEHTGAIRLPGEMLFGVNESDLTANGSRHLDRFLPVYLNVLLSEEFRPYIAEIIIEGHTDSTGSYIRNLKLSEDRAYAVARYVLDEEYMKNRLGLNYQDRKTLQSLVTASGRSFSALIYDDRGREDQDASRRVEIKFRLKDEETIALTEALLDLMSNH